MKNIVLVVLLLCLWMVSPLFGGVTCSQIADFLADPNDIDTGETGRQLLRQIYQLNPGEDSPRISFIDWFEGLKGRDTPWGRVARYQLFPWGFPEPTPEDFRMAEFQARQILAVDPIMGPLLREERNSPLISIDFQSLTPNAAENPLAFYRGFPIPTLEVAAEMRDPKELVMTAQNIGKFQLNLIHRIVETPLIASILRSGNQLPGLTYLRFFWPEATDLNQLAKSGIAELRGLTLIDLHRANANDILNLLRSPVVKGLTSLHILRNSEVRTDVNSVILYLTEDFPMTELKSLNLSRSNLNDDGLIALLEGSGVPKLEKLYLEQTPVTDLGLLRLADSPQSSELKVLHLNLDGAYLPSTFKALVESKYLRNLTSIQIGSNRFSGNDAIQLLQLPKLRAYEYRSPGSIPGMDKDQLDAHILNSIRRR